ncbi:hypothetical protein KHA80_06085 [Anaerobacillus sp. HL2]|nr:hypothetical protein KHA80_06085 [Anaerobacillus sp. HL2]
MIDIDQVSFLYPDKTEALTNITCSFSSKKIALLEVTVVENQLYCSI